MDCFQISAECMDLYISSLKATSNLFSYGNILPVKPCGWTCSLSSVNKTLGPCCELSGLHESELKSRCTKGKTLLGKRLKRRFCFSQQRRK